ncbi:hypothetical protein PG993_006053 [Apiospora rasikravindrae]|uniref:U3 small nucleolar RNA-associated protein 11 n=1 Tax=Apiospora rasikravindrae TaxID=990691 RepID=A0ABR1TD64_9PEZI
MSSMRNAVQRRNHKERSQPADRKKYGLLEKHKDYSLRAKDFNKKKAQLKSLKRKAEDKNDDEFYHGMISRAGPSTWASKGKRWTGTVDGDRGNKALPMDVVRLMKTQDMGYLRTMRNVAGKDVKALEERVIGMGGNPDKPPREDDDDDDDSEDDWEDEEGPTKKPKKIVFAEAVSDREDRILAEMEKEEAERLKEEEKNAPSDGEEENPQTLRAEQRQRMLLKLHRRLQVARKKLKTLSTAENELELQRARMAKTSTIGGVTKSGKKFKVRERKR